jgi:hypothetical protein
MSAAILLPFPGAIEALPRKRFTRDEVELLTGTIFDAHLWEIDRWRVDRQDGTELARYRFVVTVTRSFFRQ